LFINRQLADYWAPIISQLIIGQCIIGAFQLKMVNPLVARLFGPKGDQTVVLYMNQSLLPSYI